ncbi:dihydroorotase [Candidatus Halocynthiibacter alkanivorans]|uniref:dihydroorotase n=1 Tax=Candidatus Halocynthiibacter alkanivorans TaxID=2267619 RepID=UPI00190F7F3C|nr:dihydroorotase [Candidatus Halocynthiibacter alkanivorans]
MKNELILTRPDDMHLHLRDGDILAAVASYSSRDFGRAIIMPNLVPPVTTVNAALAYRDRVMAVVPATDDFTPMMTLYLTEATNPEEIARGFASGAVKAVKLYPAGATTNSEGGVRDIKKVMPVLEKMAEIGMPLLVHGEVTDPEIDIFDREAVFIDRVLDPVRRALPELRVVMEHVTTKNGVDYVKSADRGLVATLTTHHLILNRNAILAGGIRPHYYCLPVLKREKHRLALRAAAVSADPRFFLGTDSAPHPIFAKESPCGCAGMFTSINTMPILATVFEQEGKLGQLETFTSLNGAAFYGIAPNSAKIRLVKRTRPQIWPNRISAGPDEIMVFDPGFPVFWDLDRHKRPATLQKEATS